MEVLKSLEFLKNILVKRIEQIDNQIKSRETKQFYICKTCNIEFSEENALLHDFTCNECGAVFAVKDNAKLIRELEKHKKKLQEQLDEIEVELQNERDRLTKVKIKEEAKIKVAKKVARDAAKKLISSSVKKLIKKKVTKKKIIKKKVVDKKIKKEKITKKKVSLLDKVAKKVKKSIAKKYKK